MTWGLHLGGGTALGAYQVPIILHLIQELGPPLYTVGVSVGSLNGVFVGMGRQAQLPSVWKSVGEQGTSWFQSVNPDVWNGFFTLRPLRRKLRTYQIGQIRVPTYAGITNLATSSYFAAHLNLLAQQDMDDALIVSCTQPIIHERARYRGLWCADGGVRQVLPPIPPNQTPSRIVVIGCSPLEEEHRALRLSQDDLNSATEQGGAAFACLMTNTVLANVTALRQQCEQLGVRQLDFYGPKTWEDVGRPFKARTPEIDRRLNSGEHDAKCPPRLSFTF